MPDCEVCGKPIHRSEEGALIHDAPYDPWTPPIHAPREGADAFADDWDNRKASE